MLYVWVWDQFFTEGLLDQFFTEGNPVGVGTKFIDIDSCYRATSSILAMLFLLLKNGFIVVELLFHCGFGYC